MNERQATDWMGYQEPTADQNERCIAIRSNMAAAARAICRAIPEGPDRVYCLRKIREVLQASLQAICSPFPSQRQELD